MMQFNDYMNIFLNLSTWLQPAFWMWFYQVKTNKLDLLGAIQIYYPFILLVIPQIPLVETYPTLYTMAIYSSLAVSFSMWLQYMKKWHFPQALSAGFLGAFVGSYLWEVPYLIKNIPTTGLFDWMLHGYGLLLVWAISFYIGWISLSKALPWLILSLIVSLVCMALKPIAGEVMSPIESNSFIYVFNRVISTLIVFKLMKVKKNA